jgi:hypothetical protein
MAGFEVSINGWIWVSTEGGAEKVVVLSENVVLGAAQPLKFRRVQRLKKRSKIGWLWHALTASRLQDRLQPSMDCP